MKEKAEKWVNTFYFIRLKFLKILGLKPVKIKN